MKRDTVWLLLILTVINSTPGSQAPSKRFSLVEMIATGIVYVKDTRTNTYQPFILEMANIVSMIKRRNSCRNLIILTARACLKRLSAKAPAKVGRADYGNDLSNTL